MAIDYSQGTIRELQRTLNAIRGKAPNTTWGSIGVDGLWGNETLNAVRKFQEYAHLSVDGIPGPQTWGALKNYSSATSFLSAAPDGYTLAQPSIKKESPIEILDKALDYTARKIVGPFASYLQSISDEAVKQTRRLNKPVTKITGHDIDRIVRAMFNKPDVNKLRSLLDQEIIDWVKKTARGNTNAINYRHDSATVNKAQAIANANRKVSLAKVMGDKAFFDNQTINARNQRLFNELYDKCMKELARANFGQRLTAGINKLLKTPKGLKINGSRALGALAVLPIIIDLIKIGWALCTHKPTDELVKTLVADLIELAVGSVIFLAVSAIVGLFATGGIAVLIVIVVVVIISLILSFVLPEDFYSKSAEKIINGVNSLINSIIHSPALIMDPVPMA